MLNTASVHEKCCANCRYLVDFPKKNRYGDIGHLCTKTGYMTTGITKDADKVKRFTPGGRELICSFEPKRSRG